MRGASWMFFGRLKVFPSWRNGTILSERPNYLHASRPRLYSRLATIHSEPTRRVRARSCVRLDDNAREECLDILSANVGGLVPHLLSGVGQHDRCSCWERSRSL